VQVVRVNSPTRIDADVVTTAPGGIVYTQVLGAGGAVLATQSAAYEAAPGTYGVRACALQEARDAEDIPYTGIISLGAPGQTMGPASEISVAGVEATLRAVSGSGAIRTRSSLASFAVRVSPDGNVSFRYDDAAHRVHLRQSSNLSATVTGNMVRIIGVGLDLTFVDAARDSVTIKAGSYRARGTVVRGAVHIA
jgi:hypothetical protein